MTLVWNSDSLYLHGRLYMGKVVRLYQFEPQQTCVAFIQTIPTGAMIGTFANEQDARTALAAAVEAALTG